MVALSPSRQYRNLRRRLRWRLILRLGNLSSTVALSSLADGGTYIATPGGPCDAQQAHVSDPDGEQASVEDYMRHEDFSSALSLLDEFVDTVCSNAGKFGSFLVRFLACDVNFKFGRHRDLLPIGPIVGSMLTWPRVIAVESRMTFVKMLNTTLCALNWLYVGSCRVALPKNFSRLQSVAVHRLLDKFVEVARLLSRGCRCCPLGDPFLNLVEGDKTEEYPSLVAAKCDLPKHCGELSACDVLSMDHKAVVTDPIRLFTGNFTSIPRRVLFNAGNRSEYIALVLRQRKAKKLALTLDPHAAARLFVVPKNNGGQREVWDGGRLTQAAERPPKPPFLANPSALAELEASMDRPLWMTGRDAETFFDQLFLPDVLQPYFGRPFVSAGELLVGACGEAPLESLSEIRQHLHIDGDINVETQLCPISRVWPMGFGWSSLIAQNYMVDTLQSAGYSPQQLLTEEGAFPKPDAPCLSVATDDVVHFQRASPSEAGSFSSPLAPLDEEWERRGLRSQISKSYNMQCDGICLGVEVVAGVCLAPKATRLWDIFSAIIALMRSPRASPRQLSSLLGMLQWNDLMSRGMLSTFSSVYAVVRIAHEDVCIDVWPSVIIELVVNVALSAFWITDLTRPWWPFIVSTDASQSCGFGMTMAKMQPEQVRAAASAAGIPDTFFRLASEPPDSELPKRHGICYRLPLHRHSFKSDFGIRAKRKAHAGALEIQGVLLALRRVVRTARNHGHRGLILVDAQAVQAALRKGRSSAPSFKRTIRQIGATGIFADVRLKFGYVPSESNAADPPSRGFFCNDFRTRRPASEAPRTATERKFQKQRRLIRHLRRHSLYASDFDDCKFSTDSSSLRSICGSPASQCSSTAK